ncbi:MAG: CvpA family protein, partial [Salinisphaera sp.]|nr:CvpA family protein [Salinisphaera sp.]
ILGALVSHFIAQLVDSTGFSGTDRALGGVFGVLRGVGLLILLVLLAGLTPVPQDPWWQQSLFIGHLEQAAIWVRDLLPEDIGEEINYQHGDEPGNKPPKPLASTMTHPCETDSGACAPASATSQPESK